MASSPLLHRSDAFLIMGLWSKDVRERITLALSSQDQDRESSSTQADHAKVKPPSVKRHIYKSLEIQGARKATLFAQYYRQKACICQMLYNYFYEVLLIIPREINEQYNLHSITKEANSHGGILEVSSKLMLETWAKLARSMIFLVNKFAW